MTLTCIDRETRKKFVEDVYGETALRFVYGQGWLSKILGWPLLKFIVRYPWFSCLYGWMQSSSLSKKKILPFIEKFAVDMEEFEDASQFRSFNDFFYRKFKVGARKIAQSDLVMPADGRYTFFSNLDKAQVFSVKGKSFDLARFLGDEKLAQEFSGGTSFFARLCPVDYHRFHFALDCTVQDFRLINGYLYSVNPIALRRYPEILLENRRFLTVLESKNFGKVPCVEIGATNVGSIFQTCEVGKSYSKGDEKGYFAFGASALMYFFKKDTVLFDEDLLRHDVELLCKMGQPLGKHFSK